MRQSTGYGIESVEGSTAEESNVAYFQVGGNVDETQFETNQVTATPDTFESGFWRQI